MPTNALTGYYDVGRNAFGSQYYPVRTPGMLVNPSGSYGIGIPNPNEASGGWYATNLDGGPIHAVTEANYNLLNEPQRRRRDMLQAAAKVAAMIYGGAALSGVAAGGSAASGIGNAGLGFGGAATGAATGATGFGTGTAAATDAAYGALPETVGGESVAGSLTAGADTLAAAPHGIGGLLSSLVPGSGGGGSMGLGISDWLNIGNTVLGAASANRASNIEQGASQDAIAELRRQYDTTRADQAPYQAAGVKALGNLSDPNANFMASPDYAFRRSEGQRDIGNSFAARGGAFSGNALRALDQYNQSLASGEFGNWWNRQAGLAGVGQTANAQTGVLGQNTANNIAANTVGAGDARASGILNTAGIIGSGARNFVGNYLYRNAPYQPYGGYSPYQGYGG